MATQRKKKTQTKQEQLLTLDNIINEDSKYDELVKVEFSDGKYTEIYKYFRPTKVDEMLEQFSIFIKSYEEEIGKLQEKRIVDYLNIHILLYFSKLTDKVYTDFKEKVLVMKKILDSKYAEKVFEAFDKSEIQSVFERMFKKLEQVQEMIREDAEMRKQLRDYIVNSELQNKDLILGMFDGNMDVNKNGLQEHERIV